MLPSILFLLATAGTLVSGRALPDRLPFATNDTLEPIRQPHNTSSSNVGIGSTANTLVTLPPPASDTLWNKCKCKGQMLTRGMTLSDSAAGQLLNPPQSSVASRFTDFPNEFRRWYYTFKDTERSGPDISDFDAGWGIKPALKALGVSDQSTTRGGRNRILSVEHWDPRAVDEDDYGIPIEDQTYRVRLDNGRVVELPATGAKFTYAMNPQQGVILALERLGPRASADRLNIDARDRDLPQLGKSSDISWGFWKMLGGGSNVRYYFSLAITNYDTLQIMARAATDRRLKAWPGETFSIQDERGQALLGTPNAVGIGYFLMQHKSELGNLYVTAVTIFYCSRQDQAACLLYQIGPAPEQGSGSAALQGMVPQKRDSVIDMSE